MTKQEMQIMELVKSGKEVTPYDIQRKMKMAWFDLDPILDSMERNGLIRMEQRTDWGRGNEYTVLLVGNGKRGPWD